MADKDPQPVYILTGETGSGKTTFLMKLVDTLSRQDFSMAGFTAIADPGDGPAGVYHILDLGSGQKLPLATRASTDGWAKIGNFYFNPEGISLGRGILEDPRIMEHDLIIIDEIGPFELSGEVWAVPLTALLVQRSCPVLLVVRESLVDRVMEHWSLADARQIRIRDITPEQAASLITSANRESHA